MALLHLVNLLLLFPAVVEDLEDKELAWNSDQKNYDNGNNEPHLEPAFAVSSVPVGVRIAIFEDCSAGRLLPVRGKGIDDKDRESDALGDQKAEIDIVEELANIGVVGLDDDEDEEEGHAEGESESEPHSRDGIADSLEKVQDANRDGGLSERHAAAAASPWFFTCINAHTCLF